MAFIKRIIPALAGSIVLNLIHEAVRKRSKNAPQINKIAEEGIAKVSRAVSSAAPKDQNRYTTALAGDLIANTVYFRAVAGENAQETWLKGLLLGTAAGLGALTLPEHLGLDDEPVNRNTKVQSLTILYYVVGGLVTAGVYNILNRRFRK